MPNFVHALRSATAQGKFGGGGGRDSKPDLRAEARDVAAGGHRGDGQVIRDLVPILRSVISKGKFGDDRLALINGGEERKLMAAGGVGTPVEGTHGLVHQFFTDTTEGGQADARGAASLGGSGGKSNGSSGGSSHVVAPRAPGASVAAAADNGDQTAQAMQEGAVDGSREFRSDNPGTPMSPNLNNPRTQNLMRSFSSYTGPGSTPYVDDPSLGQLAGVFTSMIPGLGTVNNLGGVAADALDGGTTFASPYDGGLIGQAIDKYRGVKPGAVTGATNPDVNSSFRGTPGTTSIFDALRQITGGVPFLDPFAGMKVYSSNDASIIR